MDKKFSDYFNKKISGSKKKKSDEDSTDAPDADDAKSPFGDLSKFVSTRQKRMFKSKKLLNKQLFEMPVLIAFLLNQIKKRIEEEQKAKAKKKADKDADKDSKDDINLKGAKPADSDDSDDSKVSKKKSKKTSPWKDLSDFIKVSVAFFRFCKRTKFL